MADGNKRYLGDVFINQENYEFQNNFIRDIIESYEYINNGNFDAATLQGLGPEAFATSEQGSKAENALQSPLLIGKPSNEHYLRSLDDPNEPQYIYTDGVLLEREDGRLNAIDWYTNLANDDVTDALESIFNNVVNIQNNLQEDVNAKADDEEFQDLKEKIWSVFETVTENGQEVVKVNADFVNGLTFCLITQAGYDALPTAKKQDWRYVYIIKDSIPPEYESPLNYSLSDGYVFNIEDGFLKYKNELSDSWKTICSMEDFLEGADIFGIMRDFIENNQDYIINGTSLVESLQNISPATVTLQWQAYPFLSSSLHDDFIYDLRLNNSKEYVTETVDNNLFKNVDINVDQILKDNSVLDENGANIIDSLMETLSSQTAQLEETSTALSTAQTDIRNLQNSGTDLSNIESRLSSIDRSLSTINSNITSLNNKVNSLKTLTRYTGTFLNSSSDIYYNDNLKIAFVQIQLTHNHKKGNSGSWVKIGTIPQKFHPKQGLKVPNSPKTTIYFKYNGEILCRTDVDKDVSYTIITGATFFYD